jgi:hypothetical protein
LKSSLIGQALDPNRRKKTDFKNSNQYTAVTLKDTLVVQTGSRRYLTVEDGVQSLSSTYVICGGQSDTETEISPSAFVFPRQ